MRDTEKIVVNHVAGFFSCCTVRMNRIIDFYNENKFLPYVDSSKQWEWYMDASDFGRDITNVFFKEPVISDMMFDKIELTSDDSEEQFSDYSMINFDVINKIRDIYFTPSDNILSIIEEFKISKQINLDNVISVFYRGNDKARETNIPSYNEVLDKIKEIYSGEDIYVQTDDVNFYNYLSGFYNIKTLYNIPMLESVDNCVSKCVKDGSKKTYASLFLASVILLSGVSKVITNSGNIGLWLSIYRGNTNNFFQYLNPKEYIYGIYNKSANKYKNKWLK